MLGFDKCYHMMEVMTNEGHVAQWRQASRGEKVEWHDSIGYRATVDWPSASFWRELRFVSRRQSNSPLRDSEQWYTSVVNTIWKLSSTALEQGESRGIKGSSAL